MSDQLNTLAILLICFQPEAFQLILEEMPSYQGPEYGNISFLFDEDFDEEAFVEQFPPSLRYAGFIFANMLHSELLAYANCGFGMQPLKIEDIPHSFLKTQLFWTMLPKALFSKDEDDFNSGEEKVHYVKHHSIYRYIQQQLGFSSCLPWSTSNLVVQFYRARKEFAKKIDVDQKTCHYNQVQ